jgi:PAS domain S-box-containing protein
MEARGFGLTKSAVVALFQSSMDGFLLFEPQGRIIETNPAYERMSGFERYQLLAKTVADLETGEPGPKVID